MRFPARAPAAALLALLVVCGCPAYGRNGPACQCSCPPGSAADPTAPNTCGAVGADGCSGSCRCRPTRSLTNTLCAIGLAFPSLCIQGAGVCGGDQGRCTADSQCLGTCGAYSVSGSVSRCNTQDGRCYCARP